MNSPDQERPDSPRLRRLQSLAGVHLPSLTATAAAALSSLLLIFAFPDFNFWPLAFVALVPLLVVIGQKPSPGTAFLLGWLLGSVFFYVSCHWLTFSMINYGGLPTLVAYLLLVPGALVVGLFPALFALVQAFAIKAWRFKALLLAPILWVCFEWLRLAVTGQLWNAIGYALAYQPALIQTAQWGGVYAVSLIVVAANAIITYLILDRTFRAFLVSATIVVLIAFVNVLVNIAPQGTFDSDQRPSAHVIALQPNVPMHLVKTPAEFRELTERHLSLTRTALAQLPDYGGPRLIVWPESPMNFTYASDSQFREFIGRFARESRASIIFNSQEPAPGGGIYNSALLVNEEGTLIGQYDKIRLLPFGEYVPVPRWLPGASLITAIVGDFEPGASYTVLPAGDARVGVFICIESAYPSIARAFGQSGVDALINISNDGYLGRTAVMRQHLANAIFRAVENRRPVLRVTNTGITAYIDADGVARDGTQVFEPASRIWTIYRSTEAQTFYTKHGDVLAVICTLLTAVVLAASVWRRK